ncbi:MAG: alpha/beta hydrolase [Chloroflexota bacterium]|nr:alpha/beta hydrolase [Chloroflexota bacterium]
MLESNWVKVDGISTHYLVSGEGPPLIMIAGGGAVTAEREWAPNLQVLAKQHTIYAPDLAGYGKSDKPIVDYTHRFFNEFFDDLIAELGIESTSLMGHSLGGGIALSYTLNHPEKVNKLILIDSAGFSNEIGLMGRLITPFFKIASHLKKNSTYLSLMSSGNDKGTYEIYMDRLHEIECPTLILWGEWDGYVPVKLAYQAQQRLKNSELHVFKRGWHAPHREKPERFNRLVLDFLAQ